MEKSPGVPISQPKLFQPSTSRAQTVEVSNEVRIKDIIFKPRMSLVNILFKDKVYAEAFTKHLNAIRIRRAVPFTILGDYSNMIYIRSLYDRSVHDVIEFLNDIYRDLPTPRESLEGDEYKDIPISERFGSDWK